MPTLAATSQRHHGPAGEQLLARLRANTATAGAPEMSAVPRIQKRGEAAAPDVSYNQETMTIESIKSLHFDESSKKYSVHNMVSKSKNISK